MNDRRMYRSVTATGFGSTEVLQIVEHARRPPAPDEARIKVEAVPVVQDDIAVRQGKRPFLPKTPFVPGYSVLGVVDAVGSAVSSVTPGDRVAALTNFGSYAEYVYWPAVKLVHVPAALDAGEAVVLILNYVVAYQILHRLAGVQAGDTALIIGASGGVGTSFLQLGRLAGLRMYGLASAAKHSALCENGATPIDYRTQDFVDVIRQTEAEGLDFVFNGMAEQYIDRGLAVLRPGGMLVHYGGPESRAGFLLLLVKLGYYTLLPNRKRIRGYGTHRVNIDLLKEDWTTLFGLLAEGKIRPIIAATFPLLEAAEANRLLESGSVVGNIVLHADP